MTDKKIDVQLTKLFDLPKGELIVQDNQVDLPAQDTIDDNAEYDYEKVRGNLHTLIQQGSDALQYALDIAKSSEHPKAFEAFNLILKTLGDMNLQLMESSERYRKTTTKKQTKEQIAANPESPTTINNTAVFVGTNSDLDAVMDKIISQRLGQGTIDGSTET